MNLKTISTLTIFISCIAFSAIAASQENLSLARQCVELTGLNSELNSIPDQFDALGRQQMLTAKNPEEMRQVLQIMKESFDVGKAKESLIDYIANNVDQETLLNIKQNHEKQWIKDIVKEEKFASGQYAQSEMLRYIADLQVSPPTQERITVIQNIVEVSRVAEFATDLAERIIKGIALSAYQSSGKEIPNFEQNINRFINNIRPTMQNGIREQATLSFFYTYRNVSDDELKKYIEYTKTNEAQEFLNVAHEGIIQTLTESFVVSGDKILKQVKTNNCKQ